MNNQTIVTCFASGLPCPNPIDCARVGVCRRDRLADALAEIERREAVQP